ncbi:MAG: MerR family transcriptional regulator [Gammaproteobacteria bacterium]|nr:MerR family transcriptional regulator [Gammaproteobacteria bacterium]
MPVSPPAASPQSDAATFRSGVAARLSGVPVETLRVWERRYGVIGPARSARGQRLYSAEDVRRLTLIKQLLDQGFAIGTVFNLSGNELTRLLSAADVTPTSLAARGMVSAGRLQLALVGPTVGSRRFRESLLRHVSGTALEVTTQAVSTQTFVVIQPVIGAQQVVIELPTLNQESLGVVTQTVRHVGAGKALVLYCFAPRKVINDLRGAGHDVARAVYDVDELAALCRTLLRLPSIKLVGGTSQTGEVEHPSPPRFEESELAAFAEATSSLYCECPRHLVELVISLTAFERYSAECVSSGPEDAELHRQLQLTAGRARMLIEDAVMRVALREGMTMDRLIDIPILS